MEKQSLIQPNTTQVPHLIIREWMPRLKDVAFRVLMVVTDQTLGWEENKTTGMRKIEDWIAKSQLVKKTGRSDRAVTNALKVLVDKEGIVEARDEKGIILDTPAKRMACGDKIFYRLSLKQPQPSLFDTPAKSAGVKKVRAQNLRATKETNNTKERNNNKFYPQRRNGYHEYGFKKIGEIVKT